MSFNIGLTGIRAADSDLATTGNNIANASTVGFKRSRSEFGDVYASSALGSSSNATGSGVQLTDVAQEFTQGNVSFTDNNLDLAINGGGFFIMSDQGDVSYSRAGMFSTDREGFIVDNSNARLQGFGADPDGNIVNGVLTDLRVDIGNLAPEPTAKVESQFNLDATETSPEVLVQTASGSQVQDALANVTDNSYAPGGLTVTNGLGTTSLDFTSLLNVGGSNGANATAREVAAAVNVQNQAQSLGVTATATTRVRLSAIDAALADGDLRLALKTGATSVPSFVGLTLGTGATVDEQVANAINNLNIAGLSAAVASGGGVDITALNGEDVLVDLAVNRAVTVSGLDATGAVVGTPVAMTTAGNSALVGGQVSLNVEDGVSVDVDTTIVPATNIWTTPLPGTNSNQFDPLDPNTYNAATSVTIYDSLGNSHILTQYFVKERTDPTVSSTTSNTWSMYVLIDGRNVGNPLAGQTAAEPARYTVRFRPDGSLDPSASGPFLVSNWTPTDENGTPNGALGPNTAGTLPIPTPSSSSNFEMDITGATQFGSPFSVDDVSQDGFTTGRLTGLSFDDTGIMFARFTNGQAQVLGQVALASFANEQGLLQSGNTGWRETFESGNPVVGTPQTAALGALQSGALEDSNVDLSTELVQLIIAQRNYQSNAKTIETADQVTQTILNI